MKCYILYRTTPGSRTARFWTGFGETKFRAEAQRFPIKETAFGLRALIGMDYEVAEIDGYGALKKNRGFWLGEWTEIAG